MTIPCDFPYPHTSILTDCLLPNCPAWPGLYILQYQSHITALDTGVSPLTTPEHRRLSALDSWSAHRTCL